MIFPKNLTDEIATKILSILNTITLDLDHDSNGSGIFILTRLFYSSCLPNCSYFTYGDTLWLTVIKPINKGELITIDFNNNFYRSLEERQVDIYTRYEKRIMRRGVMIFTGKRMNKQLIILQVTIKFLKNYKFSLVFIYLKKFIFEKLDCHTYTS
jgi:hypothetical protein